MAEVEEAVEATSFDFGKKKKKTKKKTTEVEEGQTTEEQPTQQKQEEKKHEQAKGEEEEASTSAHQLIYTYEELAQRIFGLINSSRPEEKTVYKMRPPVVYRDGTKKTVWANFPEICKIMNRQADHVLSFVLAEVGSTGSIDGNGRLVIKGKFQPKHIENILRHYIGEYVKCPTCKSPETNLKKENRLLFLVCEKCGSSRSVAPIKSGFQATTRASRKADKEGH